VCSCWIISAVPRTNPPCPVLSPPGVDDGELTYENVQEAQARVSRNRSSTEPGAEPVADRRLQIAALVLLGACLFLLASAIGLGVRDRQVSQQLQQATQAHAAESSSLARSISTKEESLQRAETQLESAGQELNRTQGALQECREAENRTWGQLQQKEEELERTQSELERAEKEKGDIQAELQKALSCEQRGCCPTGWELYRWKCLFVSAERKNWQESKEACERKSSQLAIAKSWGPVLPSFLQGGDVSYWFGLRAEWRLQHRSWRWIDNTSYTGTMDIWWNDCGKVTQEKVISAKCYTVSRYICEKPASPSPSP
uniref:C-type lectin domain-containing protein n=1 Tax=Sphenodon punctatus TaxID=8508 RepID=A0A8D0HHX4_SPHPU